MVNVKCPGCKSDHTNVLYNSTDDFQEWISKNPSYKITDTFRVHGEILKCVDCGLIYVPRNEALDKLLQTFYTLQKVDEEYIVEEYGRRKSARNILNKLSVLCDGSLKKKLLDVGTGPAFFVSEATKMGWDAMGIESSEESCIFSKEKLRLSTISLGGLEVLESYPNNMYRVITAWDFIEHILEPIKFLELVFSKLEPGGVLAISTPRFDSLASKVFKEKWHAIIPSHITFFTNEVLLSYLKKIGFEVVGLRTHTRYFSIQYLLNRLFHKNNQSSLGKIVIPINLLDEIEVYCRKPVR